MANTLDSYKISKKELEKILKNCKGKTLGEVDTKNVFEKTKTKPKITGIAGDVIEQSVIGYPANSNQSPDLFVDGVYVELKTTGLIRKGSDLIAKEPCSITAVSIGEIEDQVFDTSHFWEKSKNILFVYYEYIKKNGKAVPASEYANFKIKGHKFVSFSGSDEDKLRHDWQLIHDFLKDVRDTKTEDEAKLLYPKLSSKLRKDLLLLDTAPKYPHPPRFRFKRSFVSEIYKKASATIDSTTNFNSYSEIDKKCRELTNLYAGKTIKEIANDFGIKFKLNGKSINEKLLIKMFDSSAKTFSKIEIFRKIGLIPKTIVHTKKGQRTEDTKLFQIDFEEFEKDYFLADENDNPQKEYCFEDSSMYEYFSQHQFLFMCFEEPDTKGRKYSDNKFLGFKRVYFDDDFINNNVKSSWEVIVDRVQNKSLKLEPVLTKDGKQRITPKTKIPMEAPNFPKSKEYKVFVRGGAADSSYKNEEVNGLRMIKQFIWLQGSFLAEFIKGFDYL